MKRYVRIMILSMAALVLSGCAMAEPLRSGEHPPVRLSAWMAEWDAKSGTEEFGKLEKRLESIVCFAVSYDKEDHLFLSEEIRDLAKKARKGKDSLVRYVSFTNDSMQADGHTKEKDTELLKRLLADDKAIDSQVEQMIAAAKELNCNGIELDYEKQWKDDKTKENYMMFTYRLSSACIKEGLKLRIVLEPSAPMDMEFCKGPEYVVMLYNLYGKHSGPGPKADGDFILKTIKKMEKLPGEKSVAIATGGCLWEKGGLLPGSYDRKQFLTEKEAVELRTKYQVEPERDPASAVLHFSCKVKDKDCEIWYADSETLNAWITAAANAGVSRVSIWRLGNNTDIAGIRGTAD